MKMKILCITIVAVGIAVGVSGEELTAWCTDAGTARLTDGTDVLYAAAGQGQPVNPLQAAGDTILYPGFLGGAILQPDLDTDGNGVPDEADPDNDGDGLTDLAELDGSGFDPVTATEVNLADSDGDGASDGTESETMTNPLDPDSLLKFVSIRIGTDLTLTWRARGEQDYRLQYCDDLDGGVWHDVEGIVTAAGGEYPWFATDASKAVPKDAAACRHFRVRVQPVTD